MKAKILTLILAAAVLCGRATTVDNTPAEPPYNVLEAVGNLETKYGIPSTKTTSITRNSTTNQLESSLTIIPFECPNGMGIITAVKEAFEKDKDLATRWGLFEPGNDGLMKTYTGNTPDQYIKTRENTFQGLYFINTTNPDNPTLRDQVAVQWQVRDKITGNIFRITSLKPELVEANAAKGKDDFDWSRFGIDMEKYKQGMEKYKQDMEKFRKDMENSSSFQSQIADSAAYNVTMDRIMTPIEAARERLDKADKRLDEVSARLDAYNRFPSHNYAGISGTGRKLKAYKQLLEMQNDEIAVLEQRYRDNPYNPSERRAINKRLRKLHKQAQKTSKQMQKLIMKMK